MLAIWLMVGTQAGCRQDGTPSGQESARLPNLPGVIHGTISEETRHGPVSGAIVVVHLDANPKLQTTLSSDSLGRYRVENLPIGATSLWIGCPTSTRQAAGHLKTFGLDVRPGLDTAVDAVVNTAMCDTSTATLFSVVPKAPPPEPVLPGALMSPVESENALAANYPGEEDAEIYRKALERTVEQSGTRIFVYGTTSDYCTDPKCLSELDERFRFAPSVIQSTFTNFKEIKGQVIDIRPGFYSRKEVVLVGDSVMQFLRAKSETTGKYPDDAHAFAYAQAIHDAFPTADAVITLGPVAYSTHHKQALVEITSASRFGFSARTLVLNKTPEGWLIVGEL